jgi:FAD/FMN-containing dehydrogenase
MGIDRQSSSGRGPVPVGVDAFDGILACPCDEGLDAVCSIHNAAYQRSPRYLLEAAHPEHVIWGMAFARERALQIAVRCGGRNSAGHGSSPDLVIDLTPMRSVDVDRERRTVRVGPGVTWGELSRTLRAHGLAVSSGETDSVAVGDLTAAGGNALTIDSLLSVEIVTADGHRLRAGTHENADLFRAIREEGLNFGVVTSFEFQARPVDTSKAPMNSSPSGPCST